MRRRSVKAIQVLVVVALSFLTFPAWPAGAKAPSEAATNQKRLEEWMPRLAGRFRLEGSVGIPGESEPLKRTIHGQADCRRVSGSAPINSLAAGVECFLDMTWAQSLAADSTTSKEVTPTRHSATLLYAIDRSVPGVMHMLVDDEGVAEGGTGQLLNDVLVSDSPCASIKGKCLRKVRITAEPDRQSVRMEMNMEVDGKRVGGQQLTLRREPVSP